MVFKDTNLLTLVENKRLQPFTMFWPSDEALNSLSTERKTWLYSEDHRDKLEAFMKAHMIRDTSVSDKNVLLLVLHFTIQKYLILSMSYHMPFMACIFSFSDECAG